MGGSFVQAKHVRTNCVVVGVVLFPCGGFACPGKAWTRELNVIWCCSGSLYCIEKGYTCDGLACPWRACTRELSVFVGVQVRFVA